MSISIDTALRNGKRKSNKQNDPSARHSPDTLMHSHANPIPAVKTEAYKLKKKKQLDQRHGSTGFGDWVPRKPQPACASCLHAHWIRHFSPTNSPRATSNSGTATTDPTTRDQESSRCLRQYCTKSSRIVGHAPASSISVYPRGGRGRGRENHQGRNPQARDPSERGGQNRTCSSTYPS